METGIHKTSIKKSADFASDFDSKFLNETFELFELPQQTFRLQISS